MQTFLSLPRTLFRYKRRVSLRGFSLVELLISAAIITIIAVIILVRSADFNSTVLLKSFAYEIAIALREAQIYSLSVVNTGVGAGAGYRYPYGYSFTPGASQYIFFRFNNGSNTVPPRYQAGEFTEVNRLGVPPGMQVYDVCVVNNGTEDCTITRLDVSFRRPEFTSLFYAPPLNAASTITAARVYVRSLQNASQTWIVEITSLGQIGVYKQ